MEFEVQYLDLLQHNKAPSEETISHVKQLRLKPLMERQNTTAEIQLLEALLEQAKKKLQDIETTITTYNTILSPFRSLPTDILREIFYHCLPTHRNPLMSATDVPMLLTQICSDWRSIALSTPHIWANIHISIPYLDHDDFLRPNLEQLRSTAAREWLFRSGDCPLSISLSYKNHGSLMRNGTVREEILKMLFQYVGRWRDIELDIPFGPYEKLRKEISTATLLSTVRSFKLHVDHIDKWPPDYPFPFERLPSLRKLSLTSSRMMGASFPLSSVNWRHLTSLSLHYHLPITVIMDILRQCSKLVGCKVYTAGLGRHLNPQHSVIQLLCLQSLNVRDEAGTFDMTQFFQSIKAPSLRSVVYTYRHRHQVSQAQSMALTATPLPVLSLLESTFITKLELNTADVSRPQVEACLKASAQITHLVLRYETQSTLTISCPQEDMLDDNLVMGILAGDTLRIQSLPKLEILEAFGLSDLSDDGLLKAINSGIDAWKNGERVMPLKHVSLSFKRVRQTDIINQAVQYGLAQGIDMGLELFYQPADEPMAKDSKLFSISHGLTSWDSTWPELDIDEDV